MAKTMVLELINELKFSGRFSVMRQIKLPSPGALPGREGRKRVPGNQVAETVLSMRHTWPRSHAGIDPMTDTDSCFIVNFKSTRL